MTVSNWFLYIGSFLCATGVGIVVGAIFIFYWGIMRLAESKAASSYTENNYTAIFDYKPDNNKTLPRDYVSTDTLEEGR